MRNYLLSVSLLLFVALQAAAQATFPKADGERVRYNAMVEMPKGYLSGVCILLREGNEVRGSFFNEFGISAIDFTYLIDKDKVKLHSVIAMLNKWYIKRVLKKDLRELLNRLQQGETSYRDERHKIDYRFMPMNHETDE